MGNFQSRFTTPSTVKDSHGPADTETNSPVSAPTNGSFDRHVASSKSSAQGLNDETLRPAPENPELKASDEDDIILVKEVFQTSFIEPISPKKEDSDPTANHLSKETVSPSAKIPGKSLLKSHGALKGGNESHKRTTRRSLFTYYGPNFAPHNSWPLSLLRLCQTLFFHGEIDIMN